MQYDLEVRCLEFSKEVIRITAGIKINISNENIIKQLLRSAASVGANYKEANSASSRNDFKNKIRISLKEAGETKYWIELLAEVEKDRLVALRQIWKEAHELTLIFNKISFSLKH